MLTGKCKEAFERWLRFEYFICTDLPELLAVNDIKEFYKFRLSMKYGVYVDFFDSVGIEILTKNKSAFVKSWWFDLILVFDDQNGIYITEIYYKSRIEARTAAIKKANELYNES